MTRHEVLFRGLLRLYPRAFRDRYGSEMTRVFGEQARDAAASGDPLSLASLWARSIIDVAVTAPGHHLRKEQYVPQPVDMPPDGFVPEIATRTSHAPRMVLAFLPLWILLFQLFAVPGFMDPVFASPPGIAGLPAGIGFLAIALLLTGLGAWALRRTSSRAAAILALAFLTLPAAAIVILAPAAVLIVQNLAK